MYINVNYYAELLLSQFYPQVKCESEVEYIILLTLSYT